MASRHACPVRASRHSPREGRQGKEPRARTARRVPQPYARPVCRGHHRLAQPPYVPRQHADRPQHVSTRSRLHVPHPYMASHSQREQRPVSRPLQRSGLVRQPRDRVHERAVLRVPHPRFPHTARRQQRVLRMERHGRDPAARVLVARKQRPRRCLVQPHSLIPSRGYQGTFRVHVHVVCHITPCGKHGASPSRGRVPHPHATILARRDERAAVASERDPPDAVALVASLGDIAPGPWGMRNALGRRACGRGSDLHGWSDRMRRGRRCRSTTQDQACQRATQGPSPQRPEIGVGHARHVRAWRDASQGRRCQPMAARGRIVYAAKKP